MDRNNPRVIVKRIRPSETYRHNVNPPTTMLFNNSNMSDIKLIVGDTTYYAHRLMLCAASDVFAKMLGSDWIESKVEELVLLEEPECVKVFNRFLYFLYSGSVLMSNDYVFALFMLADKYNVESLYNECVNQIIKGLRVIGPPIESQQNKSLFESDRSDFSDSDSSSTDSSTDNYNTSPSAGTSSSGNQCDMEGKTLVAAESFPMGQVVKILDYCTNERVYKAAFYNCMVRLGNQIRNGTFALWNELHESLVVKLLEHDYFFCKEQDIFRAAHSWLSYKPKRREPEIIASVLGRVRYPLLPPDQLYLVEKDDFVQACEKTKALVSEAVRYKAFKDCAQAIEGEKWCGKQYVARRLKIPK